MTFRRARAILYGFTGQRPDIMANDLDPLKLSSPRIFLIRMVVFLVLCGLIMVVLYRQIWNAFLANPGLNALIVGVLAIAPTRCAVCSGRWSTSGRWATGVLRPPGFLAAVAAGAPEASSTGGGNSRVHIIPPIAAAISKSSTIPMIQCRSFIKKSSQVSE